MPKFLKIPLWFLLGVILLVVIYYQIANWAGRTAWAEVEAELKAAGEPLTRADLIARNKKVPDEENFCAIDLLKGIEKEQGGDLEEGDGDLRLIRLRLEEIDLMKYYGEGRGGYEFPEPGNFRAIIEWDFERWAAYLIDESEFQSIDITKNPEGIVAGFLAEYQDIFDALHEANQRPEAAFTPLAPDAVIQMSDRYATWRPHFGSVIDLSDILNLRAGLGVAVKDGGTCRRSIITLLRLAEAMAHEKSYIGTLVGAQLLESADDPIYRYLQNELYGADMELAELAEAIAVLDYTEALKDALRERSVTWIECEGKFDQLNPESWYPVPDYIEKVYAIGPSGWLKRNRASACLLLLPMVESEIQGGPAVGDIQSAFAEFREKLPDRHKPVPDPKVIVLGWFSWGCQRFVERVGFSETARIQWAIAIALERHRRSEGQYPESLSELSGTYDSVDLRDPIDGRTMRYRKTPGGYVLYSIGYDGDDDGGMEHLHPPHPVGTMFMGDPYDGDWVWEIDRIGKPGTN